MPAAIEINPQSMVRQTFKAKSQFSWDESVETGRVESSKSLFRQESAMRNDKCSAVAVLAFVLFTFALAWASITGSISPASSRTSRALLFPEHR